MKRIWKNSTLLSLAIVSSAANAELNTLTVDFTPDAETFYLGETINFTVGSNGSDIQYRYVLEEITENGINRVEHSRWTSDTQFSLDTTALSLDEGDYRLRVISREMSKRDEVLVKFHTFQVNGAAPSICDNFTGGSYSNLSAVPLSVTLSYSEALQGLAMTTDNQAINIEQLILSNGQVSAYPASPMSFTLQQPFMPDTHGQATFPTPLTGSYACEGNQLTITTSGTGQISGTLGATISEVSVTFDGTLNINSASGTLETSGVVFE